MCEISAEICKGTSWFEQGVCCDRYLYKERASDAWSHDEEVSQRTSGYAKEKVSILEINGLPGSSREA